MRTFGARITAIGLLSIATYLPCAQAGGSLTSAIPAQLKTYLDRVASIRGPMTIRWTERLSPGDGDVPAEVTRYPVAFKPEDFEFTWQNGCVYFFIKQNSGLVGQVAFDGKTVYIGHPSVPIPGKTPTIPDITRITLSAAKSGRWGVNPEFLNGIGIRLPLSAVDLRRDVLRSEVSALLEDGATVLGVSTVASDDGPLTRLVLQIEDPAHARAMKMTRASIEAGARGTLMSKEDIEEMIAKAEKERQMPAFRQYVFDLDPALDGAVRGREERRGGHVLQRTKNESFRKCGTAGLWIPMKSRTQYFTSSDLPGQYFDHPILVRNMTVLDLSADHVPQEDFVLDFTQPGTRVIQSGENGVTTVYVVPATIEELDRVLASPDVKSAMHPWRSWTFWITVFVLVNVCGVAGAALLQRLKRRRRGRAT